MSLADLAAANPFVQGSLAALATFVLEDPTTVGAGLLVAAQQMSFATAMVGVSTGIALGDLGLYGIGRLAGPRVVAWGLISRARLGRAQAWYQRNLVAAVVLSRFVPGLRLPTYLGAGAAKAPVLRFLAVAVAASLAWTFLLLRLTIALGEAVLPILGRARWPVAVGALALLVVVQRRTGRRASADDPRPDRPVLSFFELWPPALFYLPVAAWWGWLTLRYRGILLPTAANPSIYSGGFVGESKRAILDLVPEPHRHWLARYGSLVREPDLESTTDRLARAMRAAGIGLPVVLKPDIGQRGAGVRVARSTGELRDELARFPVGVPLLVQELVFDTLELPPPSGFEPTSAREAGVLWWRLPGEDRGRIFSLTLKVFPEVVGDGRRTVENLVDADPRARELRGLYLERLGAEAARVPAPGERVPLVFSGNHCQGTVFLDGTPLVTEALVERFEGIARAIPEFWFGRFDVRFERLEDLLSGHGFRIVEINGAAAEATHIWDAGTTLRSAYSTLFRQFDALFRIGAANRRRGHRPLTVRRFLRDLRSFRRLAGGYPAAE